MRIVSPTIYHHRRCVLSYSMLPGICQNVSKWFDGNHGQCKITALCNGSLISRTDMGCLCAPQEGPKMLFQGTHSWTLQGTSPLMLVASVYSPPVPVIAMQAHCAPDVSMDISTHWYYNKCHFHSPIAISVRR